MLSIFLSLLSAGLLIVSFPKPDLGFLAWVALIPWFFALRNQRPKSAFLLSYLVGLIFFSGIIYWVTYVTFLGFILLVLYLALYFALFGLVFSITNYRLPIIKLFLLPSLWVSLEYIRSHLFTGFGWAVLGYSQYRYLPLIQISDITGAYGVSFLIVLVNVLIWQVLRGILEPSNQKPETEKKGLSVFCFLTPRRSLTGLLFAFLLAGGVLGYGYFKLNRQSYFCHAPTRSGHPDVASLKIAVIQGNVPQELKWNPDFAESILQKYIALTEQAAQEGPEIIIWPETSVPGYLESDARLWRKVSTLSRRIAPAYLLVGTPHLHYAGGEKARGTYNSATLISRGEVIQRYDKLHLVPFGEYLPLQGLFSRFPFANLVGSFSPGEDYTVFSLSPKTISFSVLICFEDVVAPLVRNFVRQGAQFLVNITNDAWFGDSSEPRQHLQASVFRAVENRVNVVRSANTGVSAFIDSGGRILSRVCDEAGRDVLVEGAGIERIEIVPGRSFYTRFGDIFAWLCLIINTIFVYKRFLIIH